MSAAQEPLDGVSPARHADFLRLWIGQSVSLVGAQISLVAVPLTAVLVLRADAWQMGLLGAAASLPVLVVALPVGALVDRGRPRPVLVAADVGRALLLALVPFLAAEHRLTMTALFVVAAGAGALTAAFDIAYQSYLPRLLGRAALVAGNARLEASRALSQVAGPGLGGLLVEALTGPVAAGMAALTYAVSVLSLLSIRTPDAPDEREASPPQDGTPLGRIGGGLVWLMRAPALRAVACCTATANFFGTMSGAVYVLFAVDRIGLSPLLLGLVYAGQSAGGALGAALAQRAGSRLGEGRALLLATLAFTAFPLLVPLAPRDPALAVPLLAGAGGAQALARTLFTVTQVSMRQRLAPEALLGRVNAGMRLVAWSGLPFGFLAGGLAGTRLGTVDTLWLAALGGLCSVLWLLASPLSPRRHTHAATAPAS
jgi:predicted MFS family arabinose efflux permease